VSMRVCVIDGRGGGLGRRLVAGLHAELHGGQHKIIALATNAVAAEVMEQAGASCIGVGSEAIVRTVPTVDVIVTSLNLVLPGSMLGEVTPDVVHAILTARAKKVLLPVNRAFVEVVGTEDQTLDALIARSLSRVTSLVAAAPQL
jgi:NAD(P)-dependent dehydrogenase (short-subunit alcohol dehydrogenase family)